VDTNHVPVGSFFFCGFFLRDTRRINVAKSVAMTSHSSFMGDCLVIRSSLFIRIEILAALAWIVTAFAQPAQADSLTIAYTVSQNQTAVVGPGFTVVDFTGSVTNNSSSPITFQLTGVLHNFEPYVASFVDGIPFPGITLAPGASTGVIDLAMVTLQPFDPTLTYPGNIGIQVEAINSMWGSIFTENDVSIRAVTAASEPSAMMLLLSAFAGLQLVCAAFRKSK
jgi:hypothetical protein